MSLKQRVWSVDIRLVDAARRDEILRRYRERSQRFQAVAARRTSTTEPIEFLAGAHTPERAPTAREIEVLRLVSDGLANREIGERLHLSEETVKAHVRHLLATLPARSRAHAVAVGFRRGLLT